MEIRHLERSDREGVERFLECIPEGDRTFFKEDVDDPEVRAALEKEFGADAASALTAARERVQPGDAVLVKASRSVALEGIAPTLANDTAQ